jgi:hypothetical protein
VLRPLGNLDLLNEAFHLYKRHFVLLAGVCALAYVPYFALLALVPPGSTAEAWLISSLLPVLAVAHGAMAKAAFDCHLGVPTSMAHAWGSLARRPVRLLLTGLLAWFAFFAGFSLLCLPAIHVYFAGFFLWHVMVVEERYFAAAYQRSKELASGQWGRIAVISALMLLLTAVFPTTLMLLAYLEDPSAFINPPDPQPTSLATDLMGYVIVAVILALAAPLPTILSLLLYLDTRIRREGFDVEWLASRLR